MKSHYQKKTGFAIAILFLIASTVFSQSLQDGIKATDRGLNEKAKAIFVALTKANAKDAKAWYYLGKTYVTNEQFDSAKYAFNQGIEANANEPLNYVGIGLTQQVDGKTDEAKTNFNKALLISNNKGVDVKILMGKVRMELKEIPNSKDQKVMVAIGEANLVEGHMNVEYALEILLKGLSIAPKDFDVNIALGDAYIAKNEGGTASKRYDDAVAIDGKNPKGYMRQGELYNRARNTDAAKTNYEKAIQLDAQFAPAYKELGSLYSRAGKYTEAAENYKKYIDLVGNSIPERVRYAKFLFVNNNYQGVADEYENITKMDTTKRPELIKIAAYAYLELKQYQKALDLMKTYFGVANSKKITASDYENFGRMYDKTGQDSLAVENLRKASDMDTGKVELYGTLADKYYDLKKYKDAEKYMLLKLSHKTVSPTNDHFTLGKIYYNQKNYVPADSEFAFVSRKVPNEVKPYVWRGRANAGLDADSKKGLAKPFYETLIEKAGTDAKYKDDVAEAYRYLAFYYYQKKDFVNSKAYTTKLLEIDPKNETGKQLMNYFNALDKAKQQQQNKKK
ncbi:MAG: hypothetical protein NTX03_02815 [Bacteroidetes bacterium]|nr:hypothetical protein [Bacteroidota bacterium]